MTSPNGAILVGISNPDTAARLVRLAAALAGGRRRADSGAADQTVILIHVVAVANQISLATASSSPEVVHARDLLQQASDVGREEGYPARAIVEVARSVEAGLLAAAENHDASLILVGYSGLAGDADSDAGSVADSDAGSVADSDVGWVTDSSARSATGAGAERGAGTERVFGAEASREAGAEADDRREAQERFDRTMHRVARKARSDVVVATIRHPSHDSILVPVTENAPLRLTAQLCRALTTLTGRAPSFLHVARPDASLDEVRGRIRAGLESVGLPGTGDLRVIVSDDPEAAIISESGGYDLVLLGPSGRPGILDAVFSNRARRIADAVSASVLIGWSLAEDA